MSLDREVDRIAIHLPAAPPRPDYFWMRISFLLTNSSMP